MTIPVFIVGHVNPDTDSIASAIGYAWLLREKGLSEAVAARAGNINSQTAWVLKLLNLEAPILINDASPRFDTVVRRFDSTYKGMPLRDAWEIAIRTGGIAPILNEDGTPFALITGRSLFRFLGEKAGINLNQNTINFQEILDLPCEEAGDPKYLKFNLNTKIKDVIERILREEGDEFFVIDDEGRYAGICRQKDLLDPPRMKLVLVDHNEAQQSVASLEEAQIIEILDHHRLGNPSTHNTIRMSVDIVGSTSTLVTERIEEAGLSAPPAIAGMLLAGLVSDTLNLISPTTTDRDVKAVNKLSRWTFKKGGPLDTLTADDYRQKILQASAGILNRTTDDIVGSDLKIYNSGKYRFSISQAEVSDLHEVSNFVSELTTALDKLRFDKNVDFAILMVTDVVRSNSKLIFSNPPAILDELPYKTQSDSTRIAEGVVSRKKQLLPAIFGILES